MAKDDILDLGPEFDDQKCIEFIMNLLPEEDRKGMTEDDIQYVLDVLYEYYEEAGLISDDTAAEAYIDEAAELEYIRKAAKKDKVQLSDEQIQLILDGEFQYGLELGIYEEDEE